MCIIHQNEISRQAFPIPHFLFVITPPCIIDGIMEPDGELHLSRVCCQDAGLIENGEAILDVSESVIAGSNVSTVTLSAGETHAELRKGGCRT
jgi:hypothetical protein